MAAMAGGVRNHMLTRHVDMESTLLKSWGARLIAGRLLPALHCWLAWQAYQVARQQTKHGFYQFRDCRLDQACCRLQKAVHAAAQQINASGNVVPCSPPLMLWKVCSAQRL